jgi:hypothetical protein
MIMAKKPQEETEEIELEDISLEELTEQPDTPSDSSFSEMMVSPTGDEGITPTLAATPVEDEGPVESLEEETSDAPVTSTIPEVEERDYMTVKNEPFYTSGTSEEDILHHMEERHMTARSAEQLRGVRPTVEMEDWHEAGMSDRTGGGGSLRDYAVVEAEAREESKKLPFEDKTKYRTLKQ